MDILKSFETRIEEGKVVIPSMPDILVKIKRLLDTEDYSLKDIADLIRIDAGISAKLLSVANSAAFCLRNKVLTVDQAINILGTTNVFAIVSFIILNKQFNSDRLIFNSLIRSFWISSVELAIISSELHKLDTGHSNETIFMSGLFHDIGTLLIISEYDKTLYTGDIKELVSFLETKDAIELSKKLKYILFKIWHMPEIYQKENKYVNQALDKVTAIDNLDAKAIKEQLKSFLILL